MMPRVSSWLYAQDSLLARSGNPVRFWGLNLCVKQTPLPTHFSIAPALTLPLLTPGKDSGFIGFSSGNQERLLQGDALGVWAFF